MRICNFCHIEKKDDCFRGNNKKCRSCEHQSRREYLKKYWKEHPEQRNRIVKKSKKKNADKRKLWATEYRNKNKDRINALNKESKQRNSIRVKATAKRYKATNRVRVNTYMKDYFRRRSNVDELFRLSARIRKRTCAAFKNSGYKKKGPTEQLLGAPFIVVRNHIESLLTDGMTMEKIGMEIHIDHVIPLASAKTEQELIDLCHYTNLQPLWALDNIKKGAKIISKSIK